MRIIIARHAQTTENAKTKDIGYDKESLLTEEGVKQARKLAEKLKSEKIGYAYVSPQKRAVHTAQEVLKHHPKAKIVHTEHLKEQNLGIYESVPKHVWKAVKAKATDPFHLFKPEGGESYADLQTRVKNFFNELLEKHENDTVLMVSHAGTLGVLYLHLLGKDITPENYNAHKPGNTAFTVLEMHRDKSMKVNKLNSLEHLNV